MCSIALCLIRLSLLDELGWNTTPYLVRSDLSVREYEGMGCNDSALSYLSSVKNRTAHAYETALSESTGMNRSIMTDCHVILHNGRTSSIGYVNNSTILHVATITHSDRSNIATNGSPEPN